MHWYVPASSDEQGLVVRCLHGDERAWATLFSTYHPPLLLVVRSLTRGESRVEQAEEITAKVWCSLCSDGYSRLRRYDARLGGLLNFLVGMSRNEVLSSRRADRNRLSRECRVARREATTEVADWRLMLQEFLGTLTRREREFCLTDLMKHGAAACQPELSVANGWQLRSRVLKKFRKYYIQGVL